MRLEWSPFALEDRDSIFDYIEQFLESNDLHAVSLKLRKFSEEYCQMSSVNSLIYYSLFTHEKRPKPNVSEVICEN